MLAHGVGGNLGSTLATDCLRSMTEPECHISGEVTEQRRKQERQAHVHAVETTIASHAPRCSTVCGSVTNIGAIAGLQGDSIVEIIKTAILDFAVFLQTAVKSGFDEWESCSIALRCHPSTLEMLHHSSRKATAEAHVALLTILSAILHARQLLINRATGTGFASVFNECFKESLPLNYPTF